MKRRRNPRTARYPSASTRTDGQTKVAIAAVVVSAFVGVVSAVASITASLVTTNAAHTDLRVQVAAERQRIDRAELCKVLDVAAKRLRVARVPAAAISAAIQEGASDARRAVRYARHGLRSASRDDRSLFRDDIRRIERNSRRLTTSLKLVEESNATLRLRLGEDAPASRHYRAVAGTLRLILLVRPHVFWPGSPHSLPPLVALSAWRLLRASSPKEAANRITLARAGTNRFFRDAFQLARSEVGA